MISVHAEAFDNSWKGQIGLETLPDECPVCRQYGLPTPRYGVTEKSLQTEGPPFWANVAFNCQRAACKKMFIGSYFSADSQLRFKLMSYAPITPKKTEFPEEIRALSPSFVEIFNQAEAAEAIHLEQIVGMGFRKALEFLIKDFAKGEHPGEKEGIEKKPLAACINEYIDDMNVKKVAERAAWLGNDETHYLRRWETKDVEDLKRLLGLTARAIENVVVTKKYLKEMPHAGPKAGP